MEGKVDGWIEVPGRWRRRRKQLLGNLKERQGTGNCKWKH